MDHRLAELEARLHLAEDLLETLNLTVYRQQQQLDLLQRQLRHVYRQLQEVPAAAEKKHPRDEIPPHY